MRMLVVLAIAIATAVWAEEPESITVSCAALTCSDDAPETPFDFAPCNEYELNDALIESAKSGDRSAIELLEQRYALTFTYHEKHRIAAALLGRVADDRRYWNELATRAKEAIRFAHVDDQPSPEFVQWCESRGVDPHGYRWMTIDALMTAGRDRRARSLLLEALQSKDFYVVQASLWVLAGLRDDSVLPQVERALERFPEEAESLASLLVAFRSDAADQLAMKFISEEYRGDYWEQRRQLDCETMGTCGDP